MDNQLLLLADGLQTNLNPLGEVPEGGMVIAENVVFRRKSVIEARNGFDHLHSLTTAEIHALGRYQGFTIANYSTTGLARHDGTNPWVNYSGSHTAPSAANSEGFMRFAGAEGSIYFTSSEGIKRLDNVLGTPIVAGAVAAHSFEWIVTPGTPAISDYPRLVNASGYLDDGYQVAYRFTIGFIDANGRHHIGSPSGRIVVSNSSGYLYGWVTGQSKDVLLRMILPKLPGTTSNLTTSYFVQVWRSQQVKDNSVNSPSDELYQVYEAYLTSTDITNGYVEFTDSCPDELMGDAAYFNPGQDGIQGINDMPPYCWDMVYFEKRMMYARTFGYDTFFIDLLGIGSPAGLQAGDTITIAGTAYIAGTDFNIETGFNPSVDVERTALALVAKINRSHSSIYARYVSRPDDQPGKIMLVQRTFQGGNFYVKSSRSTAWNPPVPSSDSPIGLSEAEDGTNIIYYSKPAEPEHVPPANKLRVGSANTYVQRMVQMRNVLYVFKTDGLWRIASTGQGFVVEEFDETVQLLAPNSVAVVNNKLYAWCHSGILEITESGVFPISHLIDDSLKLHAADAGLASMSLRAFALGHEFNNSYIIFMPTEAYNLGAQRGKVDTAYVFNARHRAWSKWTGMAYHCGTIDEVNRKILLAEDKWSVGIWLDKESNDYLNPDDTGFQVRFGWATSFGGDPAAGKRFTEAILMCEASTQYSLIAAFSSDLLSSGLEGTSGNLSRSHFRYVVPRDYARSGRLNIIWRYTTSSVAPPCIFGARVKYEEAGASGVK